MKKMKIQFILIIGLVLSLNACSKYDIAEPSEYDIAKMIRQAESYEPQLEKIIIEELESIIKADELIKFPCDYNEYCDEEFIDEILTKE